MESESFGSRCQPGLGEDKLALLQFASFKASVSHLCTRPTLTVRTGALVRRSSGRAWPQDDVTVT